MSPAYLVLTVLSGVIDERQGAEVDRVVDPGEGGRPHAPHRRVARPHGAP